MSRRRDHMYPSKPGSRGWCDFTHADCDVPFEYCDVDGWCYDCGEYAYYCDSYDGQVCAQHCCGSADWQSSQDDCEWYCDGCYGDCNCCGSGDECYRCFNESDCGPGEVCFWDEDGYTSCVVPIELSWSCGGGIDSSETSWYLDPVSDYEESCNDSGTYMVADNQSYGVNINDSGWDGTNNNKVEICRTDVDDCVCVWFTGDEDNNDGTNCGAIIRVYDTSGYNLMVTDSGNCSWSNGPCSWQTIECYENNDCAGYNICCNPGTSASNCSECCSNADCGDCYSCNPISGTCEYIGCDDDDDPPPDQECMNCTQCCSSTQCNEGLCECYEGKCWVYQEGDSTGDGIVNVVDIVTLVSASLGNLDTDLWGDIQFDNSDYNNDGVINVVDIVMLVNYVLGRQQLNDNDRRILENEIKKLPGYNNSMRNGIVGTGNVRTLSQAKRYQYGGRLGPRGTQRGDLGPTGSITRRRQHGGRVSNKNDGSLGPIGRQKGDLGPQGHQ
tara:strand:+ start:783 stop:2276 length:1494 start_codon:yes stop_codon:yes gene_type:complete